MGTIAWIVGIMLMLMSAMAGTVKVTDHKIGLFATMVGAIFYHIKAKDERKESIPASMMAMLSVV